MWAQHPRYYANYGGFHCSEHDMYHPESKIALYDDDLVDGKPTEGTAWHELIRSCSPEGDVDFRGFEKAGQKQADTSAGEENEAPEATVNPAPMGYKPRVDPNAGQALQKSKLKAVDQEANKLVNNMHGLDNFAGSWQSVEHISSSPFGKEFNKVRKHAEGQGWNVEETKKGWMFKAPADKIQPGFSGIVTTHASPSDHRAFKNFLGDLKNHGGLIWPPERARQREEKQQKAMEQEHNPAVCLKSQGIDPEGMDPDDVVQLHDLAHEGDERVAV
jgi:hypothetical protein